MIRLVHGMLQVTVRALPYITVECVPLCSVAACIPLDWTRMYKPNNLRGGGFVGGH